MKYLKVLTIIILFTFVIIGVESALSIELDMPQGVFYYQPASSVFGAEAVWNNPAALARYQVYSYQAMADYYDGDYAKSWGFVSNRDAVGLAYRKVNGDGGSDYSEYMLAMAVPVGQTMYLGSSYEFFTNVPDGFNDRHFWNISVLGNSGNHFSFGAVFSNLNRLKINGERTAVKQRYSLAYRPHGNKVTIAADMMLSSQTKLKNADFIYHLEFTPQKGWYINGYIDNDRNFQIGFRANIIQFFTGNKISFNRHGHHRGTNAFVGATSRKQESIIEMETRRLSMNVSGHPSENPANPIFGKKRTSYLAMLLNIYRAADDNSISEMVISLDRLSIGFAQGQELRQALEYFKSQGKQITCHISYPNNIAYYIGSVCDRILIPPISQLNLIGLRAELTFYGGTFDKLGINADLLKIGDYKTATETYTEREATAENVEQMDRLLDNLYGQFTSGIARGRGISVDSVRTIIDNGPFTSADALKYGLVDGLSYRDELKNNLSGDLPEISFRNYITDTLINDSWKRKPVLGVIVAQGEVAESSKGLTPFSADTDVTPSVMRKAFELSQRDNNIKGIIFRINSPGGYALAGEEIYHFAQKVSEKKPVFISMADMAASGGYYIAMPGQYIFANPATITGSIGIFGGKVDFSGLYEKIDLNKELFTRGKYAGMLSTMRPFTDDEREKYFSHLKAMYEHFIKLVADSRNLPVDSIDHLARGRVWTGREALSNGLVDELGGLKNTLDFAAERLQLEDYVIEIIPQKRPLFVFPAQPLLSTIASLFTHKNSDDKSDGSWLSDNTDLFYTRLPFDIDIE